MTTITRSKRKRNTGMFKNGHDPRRHVLTTAERKKGFWAAIDSIICRYPDAVSRSGVHIARSFLKSR